ncbi:MAG TPA: PGDYG domain-containing protein [Beijerinckiaceae bacterium]
MTDALPDLAADPRALRVCKKPIPVQVEFAAADGVCETLEGPVRFRAGDAILTGVEGERWPVRREMFLSGYEPVPPVRAGENGSYRKRPTVAYALRLDRPRDVPVSWQDDPLHGRAGDWLLHYADGTYGVVRDPIFRKSYSPAPGEIR